MVMPYDFNNFESNISGNKVIVFGGCSVGEKMLNDMWSIQIDDGQLPAIKVSRFFALSILLHCAQGVQGFQGLSSTVFSWCSMFSGCFFLLPDILFNLRKSSQSVPFSSYPRGRSLS